MAVLAVEAIVDAVVARLEAVFKGCAVESFPDDLATYSFSGGKPAILVRFEGSEMREDMGAAQKDAFQISVTLLTRELHREEGGYNMLEEVRVALSGRIFPPAVSPARRTASGFRSQKNKISGFASLFEMDVWLTDAPEESLIEPTLVQTLLEP